ncbi:MAG: sulfatase-like hydrolase/transferase [Firmicutes bacterium]|nr:sulfatase-like hydrolase/transferase [Bacillota bacterium]
MYRNCPIPEPVYGDWSDDENCPEPIKRFRQEWSNDLIPPEIIREARAAYYGLVTQIDYNMGRVFAALQDLGLFGDTLILFTSDHGEYLGDHHCGAKTFFHESSAHVPFFVRMPKNWDNRCHGTTISTPVTHADLLPTIVKAAGGEIPQSVDGLDLVGLARGVEKPRVYLEAGNDHPDQEYYGITDGRWKYIWYPEGASEQFFDLKNDPQELVNLSAKDEYKAQMERLKEELVRRHVERNSKAVKDGKLVSYSLRGDSTRDRRNRSWPGFHTEHFDVDVRH